MSDEKPSFTNVFAAPAIMECRDHSMNFYKGGPNTVLSSAFPPLPVVKKAGGMSYTVSFSPSSGSTRTVTMVENGSTTKLRSM